MSNKTIAIILGVLIMFGLAGIFFVLKNNSSKFTPKKNTIIDQTENTITFQTSQGPVKVNNYGLYAFSTTNKAIVIEQNSRYRIINNKSDNSFVIDLFAEPLKLNREEAENSFLNDLNISTTQACLLAVSVKTDVDPNYSQKELGLSYCPNSLVLP